MLAMKDHSLLRVNVYTVSGDNYLGMKIASDFFTEQERFFYFDDERNFRILIPTKNIIKIEIYKPE